MRKIYLFILICLLTGLIPTRLVAQITPVNNVGKPQNTLLSKTALGKTDDKNSGVNDAKITAKDKTLGINPNSLTWMNNLDLTRSNAFVENKGQFNEDLKNVDGKDILYRDDESSMLVYFTKSGLVYKLFNREKLTEKQWEKYAKENNIKNSEATEEKDKDRSIQKTSLVKMNWLGANPNPEIIADEPTGSYFNYGVDGNKNIAGNLKGYKKIIYRNIYPNIDVEYTIHDKTGIKYSFILHPGADASVIKMQYNGVSLHMDESRNVIIKNNTGTITDHAPDSYTGISNSKGKKVESSFKLNNNLVSFDLAGGNNITETTTIDPWTVGSPIPGFGATPDDVAVDGANNVIIYGFNSGTNLDVIQKYNAAGALQWTLNLNTFAGYGDGFQGDVQADNAGNIYTTIGLGTLAVGAYYNTVCINPAGSGFIWGNAAPSRGANNMYETWTLAFNCAKTTLIQSGGGLYPPANTGAEFNMSVFEPLNIGNGAEGAPLINYNLGEITSSVFGSNGLLYHLTADSDIGGQPGDQLPASAGPYNRLLCVNPATAYSTVFIVTTGYSYTDGDQKEPGSVGGNHLGVSCQYLYTTDGLNLDQRDMNTGALIRRVAIPGGNNVTTINPSPALVNGGMVFDKCGDVYVGSANQVVEFDPNLNVIGNLGGLPGTVFDMEMGSNGFIYVCGASTSSGATSFVAELGMPDCPDPTTNIVNATCAVLGSATVNPTFCSAPYTYAWSNGQTNQTATGLSAGSYTCIVNGSPQCPASYSDTVTVLITTINGLTLTMGPQTNIACNGGTSSITVNVAGGVPAYTYLWVPNGGTTATGTGLTAGTYSVDVTDANGCTSTGIVTITQPAPLTATISASTNVSCNAGSDGTITVTAGGGTPVYAYSWAPAGGTNAIATGLSANTYTVTVTDANGCTQTASLTITEPPPLTANITNTTPATCGNNNGTATVTAGGGTPNYTYVWAPIGGTNATGTGLSAGNYTVTVTDANGCTQTATATITQPPGPTATITASTNELCGGGNTATATVTAGGGAPPYTYSWAPNGGTNATGTGLTAGTYTVTVTDNNGCTATASVTITQPPPVTAAINTSTDVSCNGGNNGSATVTPGGGTGPYTYSWAPAGGTNVTATGLSANTYTVTVTDNDGCTQTASIQITQPTPLTAVASATQTTCAANTGTATVVAGGGTPNYTYVWTPGGQTNVTATALSAGIYTVTVTDANGCTQTTTASVTTLGGETVSISSSTNITCFGANNGTANSTVVGGTPAYTYAWTPAGGTNANATGLSAGIYTITVTDANGCISFTTVTITEPPVLTAAITSTTNILCNGANNGSLTVTAGGGTPNYIYNWAPAGGNAAVANGLSGGTYTCTVTDANGCTATASGTITEPPVLTANVSATVNVTCAGISDGSLAVTALGGSPAYTYSWAPAGGTAAIASGLSAGTYTIVVTDANGCTATANGTVTQPAVLTAVISNTGNIKCFGANNGTLTVTPAGGTAAYAYAWAPVGGNAATASNLSAGTYTVTVTDANNCTATVSGTITEPPVLSVLATGPSNICAGQPASLNATVTGGTPLYTYLWSTGDITSTANVIVPNTTTYTVVVTDANGCTATSTVTVTTSPPITLIVLGKISLCPGQSTTLTAAASGGNGAYTYLWQPGNNPTKSITVSPATTTTYSVQATDGCTTVTTMVTVYVNATPSVSFIANPNSGCAPLCVQFRDLSTISNTRITQWEWNFGDGDSISGKTPIHCYTGVGTYDVDLTAISDSGCSSTLKIQDMITVHPSPIAGFTYSPLPITIIDPLVQFTDNSYSKFPIIYWNWTFGDGSDSVSSLENPTHHYTDTGTFCARLVVVDEHGCTDSVTNCLVVDPLYTLYIPDAFTPNGDGINDVFMPKGMFIKDYEMYIFDRWGMKLFHSTDIFNGWNGTVNGGSSVSQEDTYIYLIKVTDTQGNFHTYEGKVSLIK